MEEIKVFEMFAGYGGASFSLKKAEIPFECVGYSEIDKYAIQCFEKNHEGKNFGDCTKINPNELPDFYLLTGGFPCQSFSVAGKGLGELDTRGTLFNEIIRIAEVKKPTWMLLENVKGLTNKNHKATFEKILSELKRIGYDVYWKVLNSKEHGIPQNRERVFFVCFRKENMFDNIENIDLGSIEIKNGFEFPEKEELKIFLKDILEEEVDEKYYLSEKQINKLKLYLGKKNKIDEKVMNCIGTCFGRSGSSKEELESFSRLNKSLYISSTQKHNTIRSDGLSNSLPSAMGMGGGHTPMIIQLNPNNKWINNRIYSPNGISPNVNVKESKNIKIITHSLYPRSGNPKQGGTGHLKKEDGTSYCLDTGNVQAIEFNSRIRKLTPKECFRLMGFLKDEINLDGLSDTQRYKLAGNGWDINLVSKIFKQMFGSPSLINQKEERKNE